ncbi:MAG: 2-oxo acid dehydrogenase subunit E2 [Pirellulaceae bacterium]|nr:2-oxo acid dehydrogenase subunit E2 [Pirellulaceae bacterium]
MAFEIVIPRLGWSMEEGTFSGWLKKDGDFVRSGEALFSLEGEKAMQDIESIDEGILRIPPNGPSVGTVVRVGAVVGYLVAEGEPLPWMNAAASEPVASGSAVTSAPSSNVTPVASPSVRRMAREVGVELSQVVGTGPRGRITTGDVLRAQTPIASNPHIGTVGRQHVARDKFFQATIASPRARRVARELNVDWRGLTGSGANGRVRERDVRAAAELGADGAMGTSFGVRQPIPSRRRVIAERLSTSRQQTVPVTLTTKADATQLIALREQLKLNAGTSPAPSYQDILIKLIARVLTKHRQLAGRWEQDAIVVPRDHEMNIGMAVDTDDGLLVPVIHDVNSLSLSELAVRSRSLIERARAGKLIASDMQGGVFTVTNLGAFGIDAFTPVINLPESAILGVGAIRMEAVATPDGKIFAQPQLSLSLTFDHRVIDGAPAARFLQELVAALEAVSKLLIL